MPLGRRRCCLRRLRREQAGARAANRLRVTPLRLEYAASLFVLSRIERRRPLQTQIERELKRRPRTGRARAELTATEQRVADLIASGATNRDAASSLFISGRTVETHVAVIYRKPGVRNRTELARRIAG